MRDGKNQTMPRSYESRTVSFARVAERRFLKRGHFPTGNTKEKMRVAVMVHYDAGDGRYVIFNQLGAIEMKDQILGYNYLKSFLKI